MRCDAVELVVELGELVWLIDELDDCDSVDPVANT